MREVVIIGKQHPSRIYEDSPCYADLPLASDIEPCVLCGKKTLVCVACIHEMKLVISERRDKLDE